MSHVTFGLAIEVNRVKKQKNKKTYRVYIYIHTQRVENEPYTMLSLRQH